MPFRARSSRGMSTQGGASWQEPLHSAAGLACYYLSGKKSVAEVACRSNPVGRWSLILCRRGCLCRSCSAKELRRNNCPNLRRMGSQPIVSTWEKHTTYFCAVPYLLWHCRTTPCPRHHNHRIARCEAGRREIEMRFCVSECRIPVHCRR